MSQKNHKESMPPKITTLEQLRKLEQSQHTPEDIKLLEKIAKYETQIPGSPIELAQTYRALGNPKSKKVIVYAQGGPATELHPLGIAQFIEKAGLDLEQYLLVQVKQQTMMNGEPELLFEQVIDSKQAKQYAQKSLELLRNVVVFLQGQGRQVSLMGISIGSFILANYLNNYGNDVYRIVFNVGRLDMPNQVVELLSAGVRGSFAKDGVTILEGQMPPFVPKMLSGNIFRIAAIFGKKRFTQELSDIDLSNAIYVYATNDQNVGRMSEAELTFLKERNIYQIYSSDKGHGGAPREYARQTTDFMLGQK